MFYIIPWHKYFYLDKYLRIYNLYRDCSTAVEVVFVWQPLDLKYFLLDGISLGGLITSLSCSSSASTIEKVSSSLKFRV